MTDNVVRSVRGMSPTRRYLTLGIAAAAVIAVWAGSHWFTAPTYVTLYHDLDLKEAGAIADHLGKSAIPFKLGTGGTEVLVPVADAARARVALAKDGLPESGRPGLELFDKPAWGMTDFSQRVTYQRALEGELARTIGGLRGVTRAEVHLILPTPSPIRRLDRPAGASVVLTLKSGTTLAPDAVQGITYIVSNSVEQLSADNVAVMDDGGHVLSAPTPTGSAAGANGRQLDFQRSIEQRLVDKIEDLLGTMVGTGRSRAEVAAEVSFDQVDRTIETYDPNGQVLQTEQKSETGTGDASNSSTVLSNSYQNSHRLERSEGAIGKVSRLTVAVLVDQDAVKAGGAALTPEHLEALVRNAIGADSTRGDRVTVMAVHFEPVAIAAGTGAASDAKPKTDVVQVVERVSRPVVGVVAVLVLLFIAFQALRASGGGAAPAASAAAGDVEIPPAIASRMNGEMAQRRTRLQSETSDQPDNTAQVLRAWLKES